MKEGRDFAAYKIYTATQERAGHVRGLTRKEATDETRFPLGPQADAKGQFVWNYGINNGDAVI